MMFVTGPAFAGKRAYVCTTRGWDESKLAQHAVWDVQDLALPGVDVAALAEELATYDVVIATEVGGGIVPMDASQRRWRETAGQLARTLAERADLVVRVCCGLPQVLKGSYS